MRVIGYLVRAQLQKGELKEFPFPGTGWETIRAAQDKERELIDGGAISVSVDAVCADQLPPPQPRQQAPRHRDIA